MAKPPYNGPWQRIRKQILNRDNYTCQIQTPGCTLKATAVDHIIPISKGGPPYDPQNLRACCQHCNNRRNTKPKPAPTLPTETPSRQW